MLECIQDLEAWKDEPNLSLPTANQILDNLERQGFDMSNKLNPWIQKLDSGLRNKVTFDVYPINPQLDIQSTKSCVFQIHNVDIVECKPKPTFEQPTPNTNPPPLIFPEIYSSRVACIYSADGKCLDMMAPGHLTSFKQLSTEPSLNVSTTILHMHLPVGPLLLNL